MEHICAAVALRYVFRPSMSRAPQPPASPAFRWGPWVIGIGAIALIAGVWQFTKPPTYTPVPAVAKEGIALAPAGPIMEPEAQAFSGYAGDATCKACHATEHEKWTPSHHSMAERPLVASLDDPAFKPERSFTHGTQTTIARASANGGAEIVSLGFHNETKPYPIQRVIGHDPLRQFLVEGSNGRLHTMEACWDPKKLEWFNVYGNEDRKPGEWGHWTGRGMVWNTMCAACHNTRVRKNYDTTTDTFHTTMAQQTVSCEACHGPMKQHAMNYQSGKWKVESRKSDAAAPPGYATTNPKPGTKNQEQSVETCGMCHARRTELTGDFKPGDNFFDHHFLAIVDQSDIFYPDGQIRDEDYEFGPFYASRMHNAGVRCMDCHDPHTAKTILPGNNLCMRCHTQGGFPNAPVIVPAQHTFHQPESTGSQCVNCHMPQTTYMQRHPRHDHGFTIPDPLLTKQFNIPNACNKCHQDKDTDWSLAAVDKWFGDKMNRRTRTRTTTIAKARRGDEDAREGLIALTQGDEIPYWKASASLLLEHWLDRPDAQAALTAQLQHPHPLVRTSAVQSLGPLCEDPNNPARGNIEKLLNDPVRSVRVAAAWATRDHLDKASVAGKELLHMLELNADQPSGQMQLAQWQYAQRDIPKAITHMKRAIAWDPGSPPFYRDLAMMQSLNGDTQDTIQSLNAAIKLNPNEPEYHYSLGLAWHEAGDLDKCIAALRDTVKLDPQHSRAWYNLGLALNTQQKIDEALAALTEAAKAAPTDPGIPYAKATIFARLGRRADALNEVSRTLMLAPSMREAIELRQTLQGK